MNLTEFQKAKEIWGRRKHEITEESIVCRVITKHDYTLFKVFGLAIFKFGSNLEFYAEDNQR